jgi:membrane associated rhomboid family serine protease
LKKGDSPVFFPTMSEKGNDLHPRPRWKFSITIVLIALNIIAYVFQKRVLPRLVDPGYLELSLWGIAHWYVWQLLTYQFMHAGWLHLTLNCWALFVFGRPVEWAVGKSRFLMVYFLSGVFGGLLQVMACYLWPHYYFGGAFYNGTFYGGTVGASAGLFGIIASFAMLFPEQPLLMLLFFVLPVKMRATTLLTVLLVTTGLGISFPRSFLGGNVAHFAHLGGILMGLAFSRFYFLKYVRLPDPAGDPV